VTSNPAHTDTTTTTTPHDQHEHDQHGSGHPRRRTFRKALTGVTLTALALGAVGGAAVAVDRRAERPDAAAAALAAAEARQSTGIADLGERGSTTSRSLRGPVDPAKAALVRAATRSGGQVTRTAKVDPVEAAAATGDPKAIAQAMLGRFGFGSDQFSCLESLWDKESGWDPHASNPSSGAYGIPQSLPGSKMASAGADWQTNPATQIEWGLGYIRDSYGSPCSAWGHSEANGWY
jgi:hypothetical protein